MVRMLADEGMSTREIAPVIGKAQQTVHDDLRLARGEVTGNRSPAKEVSVIIAEANFPTSPTIRGRDGKDYTRPTPTPVEDAENQVLRIEHGETDVSPSAQPRC